MIFRNSVVGTYKSQIVSFGGIIQMGDSYLLRPVSYALAVQREQEIFFSDEGNFNDYQIFTIQLPNVPITENVVMNVHNENPSIHVNNVYCLGISSSGIVHIGSTKHIISEARVKHIRHLMNR